MAVASEFVRTESGRSPAGGGAGGWLSVRAADRSEGLEPGNPFMDRSTIAQSFQVSWQQQLKVAELQGGKELDPGSSLKSEGDFGTGQAATEPSTAIQPGYSSAQARTTLSQATGEGMEVARSFGNLRPSASLVSVSPPLSARSSERPQLIRLASHGTPLRTEPLPAGHFSATEAVGGVGAGPQSKTRQTANASVGQVSVGRKASPPEQGIDISFPALQVPILPVPLPVPAPAHKPPAANAEARAESLPVEPSTSGVRQQVAPGSQQNLQSAAKSGSETAEWGADEPAASSPPSPTVEKAAAATSPSPTTPAAPLADVHFSPPAVLPPHVHSPNLEAACGGRMPPDADAATALQAPAPVAASDPVGAANSAPSNSSVPTNAKRGREGGAEVHNSHAVSQGDPGLTEAAEGIRVPGSNEPSAAHVPAALRPTAARETFSALDAEQPAPMQLTRAGARQAEAGYQDPALGWVGVRADLSGGGVHASLVAGSQSAAEELARHTQGISSYLAGQHIPVESVVVDSAGTHSSHAVPGDALRESKHTVLQSGTEQHSHPDPQQNSQQGSRQDAHSGPQNNDARHDAQPPYDVGQPRDDAPGAASYTAEAPIAASEVEGDPIRSASSISLVA